MAGLVLKGGELVDPCAGVRGRYDVRCRGGRVAEIGSALAGDGDQVIDVTGKLVVPGLIDQHAHCFIGASDLGVLTDGICASTGVTTFIDGGSAGAATFEGMRQFVIARSRVRILAFLNISAIGLAYLKVGELNHLPYADPAAAAAVAGEHRDLILGIKVRNQKEIVGEAGLEPLRRAVRAAELAGGLRVMIHVTNPPTPLDFILELLRPGDLVSHFLNGRGYFGVAKAAIERGFFPDTISSDLTSGGAAGVVKNLPTTLSKFLNLGMPLEEIIRAATATPARVIGQEGALGTLRRGAVADVAVFELEEGEFDFQDTDGNSLRGRRRLSPYLTVKDGDVWWQR